MMVFGTGTMVASKMMLSVKSKDLSGNITKFSKAIYQSLIMFIAMSICYPIYLISNAVQKSMKKRKRSNSGTMDSEYLTPEEKKEKRNQAIKGHCLIGIPAFCDLFATTLMTTGLMFIDVSVMQMLRGSMVIFSALLTIFYRKRKLRGFEWLGVGLCCASMVFVGLSSILGSTNKEGEKWELQLLGCLLVVGSQVVQAMQIVIEEVLLADVKLEPLVVVGMEGVWGTVLCVACFVPLFFFLPGKDNGHYEDTYDTFYKLVRSEMLIYTTIVYFVSILFLNYGGMIVTSELTAVHRTIFEALRTLFIWIVSLIIFYGGWSDYGEKWTNWSYMQLGGFLLLVTSMLLYNKVIKLTCWFKYPRKEDEVSPDPESSPSYPITSPTNYSKEENQPWMNAADTSRPLLDNRENY